MYVSGLYRNIAQEEFELNFSIEWSGEIPEALGRNLLAGYIQNYRPPVVSIKETDERDGPTRAVDTDDEK